MMLSMIVIAVLGAILVVIIPIVGWAFVQRQSAGGIVRSALHNAFSPPARTRSLLFLTVLGVPLTLFYCIALPAERFGALGWGALQFLTVGEALAAGILGFGVALSIALNLAAQRVRASQTSLTVGGLVAALLPSSLCCTTLIPSALATLGASAPAVLHLSGRFQGFFAQFSPFFLAFAVATVVFSAWLAANNLVARCTTCSHLSREV